MSWLIIVYGKNDISEAELNNGQTVTVGSGKDDALKIENQAIESGHLTLKAVDTGIHLSSVSSVTVGGDSVTNRVLSAGDIVRVSQGVSLTFFEKRRNSHHPISLAGKTEITIRRSSRKDISISGGQVSSDHATLRRKGGGWEIADDNSRNGTFVDGARVERATLRENAVIFIGGWKFRYRHDELSFINTLGKFELSPKFAAVSGSETLYTQDAAYPYFQKSPRLKPDAEKKEIEILSPPRIGEKPSVSWVSILLPPILMITVMIAVVSFSSIGSASLMFTVPMSAASIIVAVVNYNAQTKKWRLSSQTAHEKYSAYLKEREAEINTAESAYITALDSVNPSPDTCASVALRRDRRLWERSPGDDDFLTVRVGTGTIASNVTLKLPHTQFEIEDNPLLTEAEKLGERHSALSGVPVTVPFADANIAGWQGRARLFTKRFGQ